jgi:23S rRNA maturation-related 3'-5' exoribonuclease YhaM
LNDEKLEKTNENASQTNIFTDEGIKNISRFQDTLKRIHIRLISEGYTIKDGKIEKPKAALDKSTKSGIVSSHKLP